MGGRLRFLGSRCADDGSGSARGTDVTLSAADNVGVSGIEYRLGAARAWARYTSPVAVPSGSSITFRAVDVNGNIDATQTPAL